MVSKYNISYGILVLLVSILFIIVQHEFKYKNPQDTFQNILYDTWITLWVGTFICILDTIITPMNIKIFSHLNFHQLIILFKNLAFFKKWFLNKLYWIKRAQHKWAHKSWNDSCEYVLKTKIFHFLELLTDCYDSLAYIRNWQLINTSLRLL